MNECTAAAHPSAVFRLTSRPFSRASPLCCNRLTRRYHIRKIQKHTVGPGWVEQELQLKFMATYLGLALVRVVAS